MNFIFYKSQLNLMKRYARLYLRGKSKEFENLEEPKRSYLLQQYEIEAEDLDYCEHETLKRLEKDKKLINFLSYSCGSLVLLTTLSLIMNFIKKGE